MSRLLVVLSFALFISPVGADMREREPRSIPPVSATLTLPYATVLPGVPFDMIVTLKNESNRPAKVGLVARIIVALPDGRTVAPDDHSILKPHDTLSPATTIELAPGAVVQRVVSWDRGTCPNWCSHDAFSAPGDYEISLELENGAGNESANYVGKLRSSTALLERVVSPGEDESVWRRMQKAADGQWSDDGFTRLEAGVALAEEIVQLHPTSGYYPYALLLRRFFKTKDDIEPLLEAASRFKSSPAHPYLLKAAGDGALHEALRADYRQDAISAEKFYALAEKYYRDALATSSLAIRDEAERAAQNAAAGREKFNSRAR